MSHRHRQRPPSLPPPRSLGLPPKFTHYRLAQSQAVIDITESTKSTVILNMPTGCHAKGTRVVMADGRLKCVEDVRAGDELLGPDSEPRRVLLLHRGRQRLCRVIPVKGESFVVNEDHELATYTTRAGHEWSCDEPRYGSMTVRNWFTMAKFRKHITKLYRSESVEFLSIKKSLPLDPYFLGLLIGDGSMLHGVALCTPDPEIVEELKRQASLWGLRLRVNSKKNNKASNYSLVGPRAGTYGSNPLYNVVRDIGVAVICHLKHVPYEYLTASRKNRLALLAGLLDTDGHLNGANSFEIICKGDQLKDDILFLSRSLGFACTVATKTAPKICNTVYWRIVICGDTVDIPTRIPRKRAKPRKQIKKSLVTGFTIKKLNIGDYYGFTLDEDHLYLTSDFTVHHNCGKGLLPATVGILEDARILALTATKNLQDVYSLDYSPSGMRDVRGANNYSCPALLPGGQFSHLNLNSNPDPRADIGPCLSGLKCTLRSGGCPRYDAIETAKRANMVVTNYDCWLASGKAAQAGGRGGRGGWTSQKGGRASTFGPPSDEDGQDGQSGEQWGEFDYVFMDELHSASQRVGDAMKIDLDTGKIDRLLSGTHPLSVSDSIGKWMGWAREMLLEVARVWDEIKVEFKSGQVSSVLMRELREVQKLHRLLDSMTRMDDGWVVDSGWGSGGRVVTFEPVWPGRYCESLLYRGIPHRVGMSATVRPSALKYIGLREGDYDYFEYDSPFPVANRPVWQWPAVQLNYKTEKLPSTQRAWASAIDKLRGDRQDRKGIGHSVSYKRMKLYEQLTDDRERLMTHEPTTLNHELGRFERSRPEDGAFFFSPSIDTGYDAPGDRAEYNIIAKVPYPPKESVVMRARCDDDPTYQDVYAADKITQAAGRTNRQMTDRSDIIIIDSTVGALFRNYQNFARWFRQAWKFTKEAPRAIRIDRQRRR